MSTLYDLSFPPKVGFTIMAVNVGGSCFFALCLCFIPTLDCSESLDTMVAQVDLTQPQVNNYLCVKLSKKETTWLTFQKQRSLAADSPRQPDTTHSSTIGVQRSMSNSPRCGSTYSFAYFASTCGMTHAPGHVHQQCARHMQTNLITTRSHTCPRLRNK